MFRPFSRFFEVTIDSVSDDISLKSRGSGYGVTINIFTRNMIRIVRTVKKYFWSDRFSKDNYSMFIDG